MVKYAWDVNSAEFLKYVWPFFNVVNEAVNLKHLCITNHSTLCILSFHRAIENYKKQSQELCKHQTWRALLQYLMAKKPLTIVAKLTILDICGGPGYT